MENQLQTLASITQVVDPKLHQHLGNTHHSYFIINSLSLVSCMYSKLLQILLTDALGGGDYLFAFRMFMVLFRRELSFGDSLYLWEV